MPIMGGDHTDEIVRLALRRSFDIEINPRARRIGSSRTSVNENLGFAERKSAK